MRFNIAVLILAAPSNRLKDLQLLVADLLRILPFAKKGEAQSVGI